jgi:lipoprotein-releasing system permease protein
VSYEWGIGWRYLYRGTGSRRSAVGFGLSVLATLVAGAIFLLSGGESGLALIGLTGGMIATVSFALLYVFSVFTTVAVLGVVLGVAALTAVLAVTTGFQKEFQDKVLGVNAHVIIMKNTPDFSEYREVMERSKAIHPEVRSAQPFIFVEMLVTRGKGELSGVAIKGVDPERVRHVLDLERHIVDGDVAELGRERTDDRPPPIILGQVLADKLGAEVGDDLMVVAPLSNLDTRTWQNTGEPPRSQEFEVVGIFYSGFDEYDRRLMYINIEEAQELLGRGDKVMGVELTVANIDRARMIADLLDEELGGSPYVIQDWYDLNHNLFTALALQKVALLIVLTLIIAVATFNMVSALTLMVIDKTREIAILKSMGSTSPSIARIFQVVGVGIGGIGTVFGLTIGLVVCWAMAAYDYQLDPQIYLIDRLPIEVVPFEVVLVGVITMVISALATVFPSAKASRLPPVEGLRYD